MRLQVEDQASDERGDKRMSEEIDLSASSNSTNPVNTFLCYGDSKSGKTTFAGTFPRPLFFSDLSEGGFESLREDNWDETKTPLFEEGIRPIVWSMSKRTDMAENVEKAKPLIAAGRVKTIVVDSISFYADLIMDFILTGQTKKDNRGAYDDLGNHLRNTRVKLHDLGVNVVHLALAKSPEIDDQTKQLTSKGLPMIPGRESKKFAAGVHYTFFFKHQPSPAQFQIYTKEYANYVAGNRLGKRADLLPNPMVGATYASMMACLGYDVDAIRNALPRLIDAPKIVTVKPSAPPIRSATSVIRTIARS
jgi:hypothetical protein